MTFYSKLFLIVITLIALGLFIRSIVKSFFMKSNMARTHGTGTCQMSSYPVFDVNSSNFFKRKSSLVCIDALQTLTPLAAPKKSRQFNNNMDIRISYSYNKDNLLTPDFSIKANIFTRFKKQVRLIYHVAIERNERFTLLPLLYLWIIRLVNGFAIPMLLFSLFYMIFKYVVTLMFDMPYIDIINQGHFDIVEEQQKEQNSAITRRDLRKIWPDRVKLNKKMSAVISNQKVDRSDPNLRFLMKQILIDDLRTRTEHKPVFDYTNAEFTMKDWIAYFFMFTFCCLFCNYFWHFIEIPNKKVVIPSLSLFGTKMRWWAKYFLTGSGWFYNDNFFEYQEIDALDYDEEKGFRERLRHFMKIFYERLDIIWDGFEPAELVEERELVGQNKVAFYNWVKKHIYLDLNNHDDRKKFANFLDHYPETYKQIQDALPDSDPKASYLRPMFRIKNKFDREELLRPEDWIGDIEREEPHPIYDNIFYMNVDSPNDYSMFYAIDVVDKFQPPNNAESLSSEYQLKRILKSVKFRMYNSPFELFSGRSISPYYNLDPEPDILDMADDEPLGKEQEEEYALMDHYETKMAPILLRRMLQEVDFVNTRLKPIVENPTLDKEPFPYRPVIKMGSTSQEVRINILKWRTAINALKLKKFFYQSQIDMVVKARSADELGKFGQILYPDYMKAPIVKIRKVGHLEKVTRFVPHETYFLEAREIARKSGYFLESIMKPAYWPTYNEEHAADSEDETRPKKTEADLVGKFKFYTKNKEYKEVENTFYDYAYSDCEDEELKIKKLEDYEEDEIDVFTRSAFHRGVIMREKRELLDELNENFLSTRRGARKVFVRKAKRLAQQSNLEQKIEALTYYVDRRGEYTTVPRLNLEELRIYRPKCDLKVLRPRQYVERFGGPKLGFDLMDIRDLREGKQSISRLLKIPHVFMEDPIEFKSELSEAANLFMRYKHRLTRLFAIVPPFNKRVPVDFHQKFMYAVLNVQIPRHLSLDLAKKMMLDKSETYMAYRFAILENLPKLFQGPKLKELDRIYVSINNPFMDEVYEQIGTKILLYSFFKTDFFIKNQMDFENNRFKVNLPFEYIRWLPKSWSFPNYDFFCYMFLKHAALTKNLPIEQEQTLIPVLNEQQEIVTKISEGIGIESAAQLIESSNKSDVAPVIRGRFAKAWQEVGKKANNPKTIITDQQPLAAPSDHKAQQLPLFDRQGVMEMLLQKHRYNRVDLLLNSWLQDNKNLKLMHGKRAIEIAKFNKELKDLMAEHKAKLILLDFEVEKLKAEDKVAVELAAKKEEEEGNDTVTSNENFKVRGVKQKVIVPENHFSYFNNVVAHTNTDLVTDSDSESENFGSSEEEEEEEEESSSSSSSSFSGSGEEGIDSSFLSSDYKFIISENAAKISDKLRTKEEIFEEKVRAEGLAKTIGRKHTKELIKKVETESKPFMQKTNKTIDLVKRIDPEKWKDKIKSLIGHPQPVQQIKEWIAEAQRRNIDISDLGVPREPQKVASTEVVVERKNSDLGVPREPETITEEEERRKEVLRTSFLKVWNRMRQQHTTGGSLIRFTEEQLERLGREEIKVEEIEEEEIEEGEAEMQAEMDKPAEQSEEEEEEEEVELGGDEEADKPLHSSSEEEDKNKQKFLSQSVNSTISSVSSVILESKLPSQPETVSKTGTSASSTTSINQIQSTKIEEIIDFKSKLAPLLEKRPPRKTGYYENESSESDGYIKYANEAVGVIKPTKLQMIFDESQETVDERYRAAVPVYSQEKFNETFSSVINLIRGLNPQSPPTQSIQVPEKEQPQYTFPASQTSALRSLRKGGDLSFTRKKLENEIEMSIYRSESESSMFSQGEPASSSEFEQEEGMYLSDEEQKDEPYMPMSNFMQEEKEFKKKIPLNTFSPFSDTPVYTKEELAEEIAAANRAKDIKVNFNKGGSKELDSAEEKMLDSYYEEQEMFLEQEQAKWEEQLALDNFEEWKTQTMEEDYAEWEEETRIMGEQMLERMHVDLTDKQQKDIMEYFNKYTAGAAFGEDLQISDWTINEEGETTTTTTTNTNDIIKEESTIQKNEIVEVPPLLPSFDQELKNTILDNSVSIEQSSSDSAVNLNQNLNQEVGGVRQRQRIPLWDVRNDNIIGFQRFNSLNLNDEQHPMIRGREVLQESIHNSDEEEKIPDLVAATPPRVLTLADREVIDEYIRSLRPAYLLPDTSSEEESEVSEEILEHEGEPLDFDYDSDILFEFLVRNELDPTTAFPELPRLKLAKGIKYEIDYEYRKQSLLAYRAWLESLGEERRTELFKVVARIKEERAREEEDKKKDE